MSTANDMTGKVRPAGRARAFTAIAAIALLSGTFYLGWSRIAPHLQGDLVETETGSGIRHETLDAGRFSLFDTLTGKPVIVTATLEIATSEPVQMARIRDSLQDLLVTAVEIPVVSADGLDLDGIEQAVLAMAPQEATWLSGIELGLLSR